METALKTARAASAAVTLIGVIGMLLGLFALALYVICAWVDWIKSVQIEYGFLAMVAAMTVPGFFIAALGIFGVVIFDRKAS